MTQGARVAAAVTIALLGCLLAWNVGQYPWRKGYDATANAHYAETLRSFRLPGPEDTDAWHNPPLWFVIAGATYKGAELAGLRDPGLPVQLLSSVCVLGLVLLTGLLARELFPDRPVVVPLAVLAAAVTPVLVRSGVLFHPEPLAALLVTGALLLFVRTVARGRADGSTGALVGALAGLACLTRTWGLAAAAALVVGACLHAAAARSPASRRFAVTATAVVAALVVPWLAVKTVTNGSPFAFNGDPGRQSDPDQWRTGGQPRSFFLSLDADKALTTPYQPYFRNHLVPTVYSDWFGDYWRSYDVPSALKDEPDRLPARWEDPLARQSWAGLAFGTVTLVGAVGLGRRAIGRRDVALGTVLLSALLLAVSFVAFLVRYPKQDGDTIKALYLLNAVPVAALCAAWGASTLAGGSRWRAVGVGAVLLAAAAATVSFLVLTPA